MFLNCSGIIHFDAPRSVGLAIMIARRPSIVGIPWKMKSTFQLDCNRSQGCTLQTGRLVQYYTNQSRKYYSLRGYRDCRVRYIDCRLSFNSDLKISTSNLPSASTFN